MCRLIYFISILYIMLNTMASEASTIDPAGLIKVTPNNNVKCVDYYNYKGELYCSTTGQNPQPVDPHLKEFEKLKIVFDDRPWQIGWGKKEPTVTMIEYIPNGEDIEHWNELITSQFFPELHNNITPKQFADLFVEKLKDQGYKPIVTFFEDTPDQVIYEYRIEQPENQMQDEMQMITVDNKGLYILHYVIKKADMGQKNREKWFHNLKNSMIKQ